MSYILDALKKFDDERFKKKTVPDLYASAEPKSGQGKNRHSLWPYALVALLAINTTGLLLLLITQWNEKPDTPPLQPPLVSTIHPGGGNAPSAGQEAPNPIEETPAEQPAPILPSEKNPLNKSMPEMNTEPRHESRSRAQMVRRPTSMSSKTIELYEQLAIIEDLIRQDRASSISRDDWGMENVGRRGDPYSLENENPRRGGRLMQRNDTYDSSSRGAARPRKKEEQSSNPYLDPYDTEAAASRYAKDERARARNGSAYETGNVIPHGHMENEADLPTEPLSNPHEENYTGSAEEFQEPPLVEASEMDTEEPVMTAQENSVAPDRESQTDLSLESFPHPSAAKASSIAKKKKDMLITPHIANLTPPIQRGKKKALAAAEMGKEDASGKAPDFNDLPDAVREQIPEINITVHYFENAGGPRFVVVNGKKKKEGDQLGESLKVEEITSNGVIFNFKGEKFYRSVF